MIKPTTNLVKSYLYIVTPLMYVQALSIIASELLLLTSTELQDLSACLPFLASIVLHQPLVLPYWQRILVQHSKCEVCIIIVTHSPLLVRPVTRDYPAFWANISSGVLFFG